MTVRLLYVKEGHLNWPRSTPVAPPPPIPCIRRTSTPATLSAYRELRAGTPVVWNDVTDFWALCKYEDVRFVSGNPGLFTSTKGITIPDPEQPEPVQEGNLIFTDPPRHRQLRNLINAGFTRRQVTLLEPKIRSLVKGIVDGIDSTREYEFAEEIAAPLPTRMIAEMLGAPPEDWEQFRTWSDAAVGTADPDIEMDSLQALAELFNYFTKLIADRRSGEVSGEDLLDPRRGRGRR